MFAEHGVPDPLAQDVLERRVEMNHILYLELSSRYSMWIISKDGTSEKIGANCPRSPRNGSPFRGERGQFTLAVSWRVSTSTCVLNGDLAVGAVVVDHIRSIQS